MVILIYLYFTYKMSCGSSSPIPIDIGATTFVIFTCNSALNFSILRLASDELVLQFTSQSEILPNGQVFIFQSPFNATGLFASVGITSLPNRMIHVTFNVTATMVASYDITFDSTFTSLTVTNASISNVPVTSPPIATPEITISALASDYTNNLLTTTFIVNNGKTYECGLGCYKGYTIPISTGTEIFVENFNLQDAMIGPECEGSLIFKLNSLDLDSTFVLYALYKALFGRLLFKELNLKWLLRENYCKLTDAVEESEFSNYSAYLEANKGFEVYFK